jgi:pyruvyltransferase
MTRGETNSPEENRVEAQRRPHRKRVAVYRARKRSSQHGNFGDEITIPILDRLFGVEAIPTDMGNAELIGSGSTLDAFWNDLSRKRNRGLRQRIAAWQLMPALNWLKQRGELHIWGSGFIRADSRMVWPQRIHLHAVRGELSASRVGSPLSCLGDPGILASLLIDRARDKMIEVAVVPHRVDSEWLASRLPARKHWQVVNPEQPVFDVLEKIAAAELVIASSLHGLIVADAFGVPCIWIEPHNRIAYDSYFKFDDYASSRRQPFNTRLTYDRAFSLSVDEMAAVATTAARSIPEWQAELVGAFPFSGS